MPPRSSTSSLTLPKAQVLAQFAQTLLEFYAQNARSLPWRDQPTAYAVWVSEMMLQQTQVTTVLPYYARWMQRFPTVEVLANAEQSDVPRRGRDSVITRAPVHCMRGHNTWSQFAAGRCQAKPPN